MAKNKILAVLFFATCICGMLWADNTTESRREKFLFSRRVQMVEEQIRQRGIADPAVLDAMLKVERHLFVPGNVTEAAYEDMPLPIGYDQTISQPYIVAYMTELAQVNKNDKVLEIGTGSGYQAAVLSEMAREVYTIEIIKELADSARERLERLGYKNVKVHWGDGYKGWPEKAPFDVIIVTAAPPEVPEELVNQLAVGGRMVIPVGTYFQQIFMIERTAEGTTRKVLIPVRFVPMVRGDER